MSEGKGYNPMKGKVMDVSVKKKDLFVEAEELMQRSFHSGTEMRRTPSDEQIEADIIRPKKTSEVTVCHESILS